MEFRTLGCPYKVRLTLADPQKRPAQHHCCDYCHGEERERQDRLRNRFGVEAFPGDRRLLALGVKHVCGPWCMQVDPETPVRLGGRGSPVSYGLDFLSPASRDLLARLRGVA